MGFASRYVSSILSTCKRGLGEVVTYRPAAYPELEVDAPFASTLEVTGEDGIAVSVAAPNIYVQLSDLPAAPVPSVEGSEEGDEVVVLGNTFKVDEVFADENGGARLVLRKSTVVGIRATSPAFGSTTYPAVIT